MIAIPIIILTPHRFNYEEVLLRLQGVHHNVVNILHHSQMVISKIRIKGKVIYFCGMITCSDLL